MRLRRWRSWPCVGLCVPACSEGGLIEASVPEVGSVQPWADPSCETRSATKPTMMASLQFLPSALTKCCMPTAEGADGKLPDDDPDGPG